MAPEVAAGSARHAEGSAALAPATGGQAASTTPAPQRRPDGGLMAIRSETQAINDQGASHDEFHWDALERKDQYDILLD